MNKLSERFRTVTQQIEIQETCESILRPFILKFFIYKRDLYPKQYNRLERSSVAVLLRLLDFSKDGDYQSYIKYWHDIYLCRVVNDPTTPPIEIRFKTELYSGILRRIVRHALLRKDCSFIYSLQKGSKRVWPILPPKKEMAALEKHRTLLSGNYPDFDPFISRELSEGIEREGYLTFRPLLNSGIGEEREVLYTKFSPSLSAENIVTGKQIGRAHV